MEVILYIGILLAYFVVMMFIGAKNSRRAKSVN